MATQAPDELHGFDPLLDRALRAVGSSTHSLRQRLLARNVGRTVPTDHWVPAATRETGLTADDLRRHAAHIRRTRRPTT